MTGSRISFPYPVLGNGDDIQDGDFKPSLQYSITPDFVTMECGFELTNTDIASLVEEHVAAFLVEIECGNTYYRSTKQTSDRAMSIQIPVSELRERVDIGFYICTTQSLEAYLPAGAHEDFGDEPFYLEAGDIIALGGTTSFVVAKEFDPLNAPISSIIKLEKSTKNNADMRVSYDGERIVIQLPKKDFEAYSLIKSSSAELLHSTIVLPVLVDAIYEISDRGSGNYDGTVWSDRLRQICIERDINIDEPLVAAQRILNYPINRTLEWRSKNIMEMEEE